MIPPAPSATGSVVSGSPLGRPVGYGGPYNPDLLHPMAREPQREALGIRAAATLPFLGADLWTAYELSWLNRRGKPQLAIAHLTVPAETAFMVESKSLKLYLNSFSETVFDSAQAVQATLVRDLNAAVWQGQTVMSGVGVRLVLPEAFAGEQLAEPDGLCVDRLEIECTHERPAAELLQAAHDEAPVTELLFSRLLKSNCPVTGQPDWGCVQIGYSGPQIDQAGLLRYLVSFRQHPDFHEQCVERIFLDIRQQCRPARLWVLARYTRRVGIDISPWRSSHPMAVPPHQRTARQ